MTGLAPAWIAWIAENRLRGAADDELCDGLVAGGLEREVATVQLVALLSDPVWAGVWAGAQRLVERSAAMEQVARLRKAVDGPVEELGSLDDDGLWRHHWTRNQPVVLRGAASAWPAARWDPESLAARFGDVPVNVLCGRRPGWWRGEREIARMPLRDLLTAEEGDERYADGRCDVFDEPGLARLRAELGRLPGLADDGLPRAWIGPRGTLTPLHHDQSSGWLVQLVGHKRIRLASPLEASLASTADGLYNLADPSEPGGDVRWHEVVLGPGDAVFVPVGWWHEVAALSPSISVSFAGFRWPNAHTWYLPGRARAQGRPRSQA